MTSQTVKPGDVLAGKYRVERVLGSGGMGYVVAARHLQLDQLVAMKFLRKSAVENSEAERRFLREAKAAVKLKNEHIAKVFDVGALESGEPYIVMEHLDGCDLSELAKQRHTLPPSEVCEYIMQACEALAEAHSLHIVHRDIKLANLFVTRGPAGGPLVKVLDFGISKTNPFGESDHDMTRTASMLGSPRFMSPEQMRDPRAVDGRSDIWSLGVVIYRLVSGRPPFEAETLGRLLTMVMHEQEPPLSSVRHDLPPGFDEVVGRCLAKDPNERYANVAELAYALVPFIDDAHGAQAAAERIAAVLSLPHPPASDLSLQSGSNHSGIDSVRNGSFREDGSRRLNANGDGTASPWSGTHDGYRRGPRGSTIGVAAASLAILVGIGFLAKARYEEVSRQQASANNAVTQIPTPMQAPTFDNQGGSRAARPGDPIPSTTPQQLPAIIGASPIPPTPPPVVAADAPPDRSERVPPVRRVVATPRTRPAPAVRAPTPASNPVTPAPPPPPKAESGIPNTRD